MAQLFTTEQAAELLGIGHATFPRWVKEAENAGLGEKVKSQTGIDARTRLYTYAQIRWLANRHAKDLPPAEEIYSGGTRRRERGEGEEGDHLDAPTTQDIALAPDGEWELKTKEVVATALQTWQQTDATWLELIEENKQLRKDLAQAQKDIKQLRNDLAALQSSQLEATVLEFLSKHLPQMNEPPKLVQERRGSDTVRVQAPSTPVHPNQTDYAPGSVLATAKGKRSQRSRVSDPSAPVVDDTKPLNVYADLYRRDGLVALAQFEQLHNVRHQNVQYYLTQISPRQIHWTKMSGLPYFRQGIDKSGEAEFYKHCHKLSGFRRCDHCPHDHATDLTLSGE